MLNLTAFDWLAKMTTREELITGTCGIIRESRNINILTKCSVDDTVYLLYLTRDSTNEERNSTVWTRGREVTPTPGIGIGYNFRQTTTAHLNHDKTTSPKMTLQEKLTWLEQHIYTTANTINFLRNEAGVKLQPERWDTADSLPVLTRTEYYTPSERFIKNHGIQLSDLTADNFPHGFLEQRAHSYRNTFQTVRGFCCICYNTWDEVIDSRQDEKDYAHMFYTGIPGLAQGALACRNCVRSYITFCSKNNGHYTFRGGQWAIGTNQIHRHTETNKTEQTGQIMCPHCRSTEPEVEIEEPVFCATCHFKVTQDSINHAFDDLAQAELEANQRTNPINRLGICRYCAANNWVTCFDCKKYVNTRNTISIRNGRRCEGCMGNTRIKNYSYKPTALFKPKAQPKTLFMGMELETCMPETYDPTTWVREYGNMFPTDLFYIKSDSSLRNGMEIVTHPFTPDWGMEHFPFDTFQKCVDKGYFLETHSTAGQHIHVSKDAFTGVHLWKFCMMHWKYAALIQLIGGRPYSFSADYKEHTKTTAAGGFTTGMYTTTQLAALGLIELEPKPSKTLLKPEDEELLALEKTMPKSKDLELTKAASAFAGKKAVNGNRSIALNFQNKHTIELRYPAATASAFGIRKNIEWIKAAFEFSRQLAAEDLQEEVLGDQGYLTGFIHDQKEKWPTLSKHLHTVVPEAKILPSFRKKKS